MKTYYYVDSLNTTQGPVSLSDLEKLHMEKTITSTTQINEVGSEDWIPFYQVNLEKPSTKSPLKDHSSSVITSEDRQKMVLLKKEKTRHSLTGYDVKAGIQTTPLRLYSFLR